MASRAQAIGGHPDAGTVRSDVWWVEPVVTVAVLGLAALYITWAAFQGTHYYVAPYLSPLYSPIFFTDTSQPGAAPLEHALFGAWPSWWPSFLPSSPAFFILIFPGLFRFTCYYYRKAYYRAFTGSPPACAVVPLAKSRRYEGETHWLLFQNLHRYALYLAIPFIPILTWDALQSFVKEGRFGVGVGSLVLSINAAALAGYLFGCHSLRHLVGGHDDCMSCGRKSARYQSWSFFTRFNEKHANFAWFSLVWVVLTDVYVRLVSMGVIHDFNTWGS
jgi:hypothetical protein